MYYFFMCLKFEIKILIKKKSRISYLAKSCHAIYHERWTIYRGLQMCFSRSPIIFILNIFFKLTFLMISILSRFKCLGSYLSKLSHVYNDRFFFDRANVNGNWRGPTDASWRIVQSWWSGHGFSCDGGAMTLNHRPPSSAGVPQDSPSFLLSIPVPIPVSDNCHYLARNIVKTRATVAAGRRYERPPSSLPRSRTRHATRGGSRAVTSTLQNRWVTPLWHDVFLLSRD